MLVDIELLNDYNQWVIAHKGVPFDTSPEAFAEYTLREQAVERLVKIDDYLSKCGVLRMEPSKHRIKKIVDGTDDDDVELEEADGTGAGEELKAPVEPEGY